MGEGRKRKGEEENRYLLEWSERARERERMECKKREWTSGRDWLKGHLRQGPRQLFVLCTVLLLHTSLHHTTTPLPIRTAVLMGEPEWQQKKRQQATAAQ